METPEASLVLPVYNEGRRLEETLAAIRDTTNIRYEAIVVNDASTDFALRFSARRSGRMPGGDFRESEIGADLRHRRTSRNRRQVGCRAGRIEQAGLWEVNYGYRRRNQRRETVPHTESARGKAVKHADFQEALRFQSEWRPERSVDDRRRLLLGHLHTRPVEVISNHGSAGVGEVPNNAGAAQMIRGGYIIRAWTNGEVNRIPMLGGIERRMLMIVADQEI
jgi:hypothetical protein